MIINTIHLLKLGLKKKNKALGSTVFPGKEDTTK
jgi:hypothetical protein